MVVCIPQPEDSLVGTSRNCLYPTPICGELTIILVGQKNVSPKNIDLEHDELSYVYPTVCSF